MSTQTTGHISYVEYDSSGDPVNPNRPHPISLEGCPRPLNRVFGGGGSPPPPPPPPPVFNIDINTLTEAQILLRTGDAVGVIAFGTDTKDLYVYDGSAWQIFNNS